MNIEHRVAIWLSVILCSLALSACTSQPAAPEAEKPCRPKPAPVVSGSLNDELLSYYLAQKQSSPSEWQKQLQHLNETPTSIRHDMQRAIILGFMRDTTSLNRAIVCLDGVLKSEDKDSEPVKPLARILYVNYSEWRRMDEALEKQSAQLRDMQKNIDQLTQKLDDLKAIEKQILVRPRSGGESR